MSFKDDADFLACLPYVLSVEGGYVNNPHDPGGPTKYGIAYNFNKTALAKLGITAPTQIQSLTQDQATEIYYQNYWVSVGCVNAFDIRLKLVLFDTAVNEGVSEALSFLKQLGNIPKQDPEISNYIFKFFALRLKAYTQKSNKKFFLPGWVNRLANIMTKLDNLKGK